MKLLKLIYRQSDHKGLDRCWKSFKIAVLVSAIAAGLIPNRMEATDSANTTQPAVIGWVVETLRGGFISMDQRHLQSHEIDKTIFESDDKIRKEYDKLVKSNKTLEKKFDALEKKISQGHFNFGREKGF